MFSNHVQSLEISGVYSRVCFRNYKFRACGRSGYVKISFKEAGSIFHSCEMGGVITTSKVGFWAHLRACGWN